MNSANRLKILLIGDSSVGKSCVSTIGYEFRKSVITINDKEYDLAIWDTAGEEKNHALTPIFYRNCHGVILVYDVTRRNTLENITSWSDNVDLHSRQVNFDVVKLLVGNKIDMPLRDVSKEEGAEFARRNGMLFLETSAKTRENVDLAFEEVVRKIVEQPNFDAQTHNGFKVNDRPLETSSWCQC